MKVDRLKRVKEKRREARKTEEKMKRTVEVGAGVGVEKEKGKGKRKKEKGNYNSKKTRSVTKSNPQEVATGDAKCRNPLSKPALFPYKKGWCCSSEHLHQKEAPMLFVCRPGRVLQDVRAELS